tara:strand:- start:363 stop:938 length:576 start_codon:yes stop_codon:yes gene_type:complete
MNVSIKVKKTHPDAVLPVANNKDLGTGDTGYDLTAIEPQHIQAGKSKVVSVGLTLAYITPGYWFRIEPRSGLGFKNSVQPHLGVIDNGYRGDLGVKLYNFHEKTSISVKKGDKIAQLVVYPLIQPVFEFADEVSESARGNKGFGSSDEPVSAGSNDDVHWEYSSYTGIVTDINETVAVPKLDQGDPLYKEV